MKVAMLTLAVPIPGHPSIGLYNLAQCRAIQSLGHEARIFTCAPKFPKVLRHLSNTIARHIERPHKQEINGIVVSASRVPFAYTRKIRESLAPRCPNTVLHLFTAAAKAPIFSALDAYQPDAIIMHGIFPWGQIATRYKKTRKTRLIAIEHSQSDIRNISNAPRMGKCYAMHAAQCERVFAVNHAMVDAIKSLAVTNAAPIFNGINRACVSQPCHESHPRDPRKPFTVLCAGQYIERKGHAYLLEAFADPRLRHVQLELVGHPPTHLQRQIDELGIQSQISILEEMDQSALLDRMAQSDLFALPSWDEAFGLVYAEALSVGTPVLLTNDAGIHALPHIDESSWVVPPRDSGAIAKAILAAIALDAPTRARMTLRASAWMHQNLTWEQNAQTLLQAAQHGFRWV